MILLYFLLKLINLLNFTNPLMPFFIFFISQQLRNNKMIRQQPLFYLLFLTLCTLGQGFYCPSGSYQGSAFSGELVAGFGTGDITLKEEQQIFLYNYSMPFQFQNRPQIAIAVHDFEFQPSKHIFYYIKHLHTQSISSILFAIRIQWPYTRWKQLSFTFLAEDRTDLQSGYYLVDSRQLSGCKIGKSVQAFLPFRTQFKFTYQIRHQLFLHGFQISTTLIQKIYRSPFQLQITSSFADQTVTTQTQVNSIFVSYIAYQQINLNIMEGKYVYDSSVKGSNLHHRVQNMNKRSYSRIYGMRGFIINHSSQKMIFSTRWDGLSFIFNFGTATQNVKYLSYQYLFFMGSSCSNCPGYNIMHDGICITSCPLGTSLTSDDTCISCGQGKYFNGSACVTRCVDGYYINGVLNCTCPNDYNWDGYNCISCNLGRLWNNNTRMCQCTFPHIWNGFACARFDQCQSGKVWDPFLYSCACPQDSYWNGKQCQIIPICQGGQILDSNTYTCKCPKNQIWVDNSCKYTSCFGGQYWFIDKCICALGFNFNGSRCVQCKDRQRWNEQKKICECSSQFEWNGRYCQRIINCQQTGRIWSDLMGQCVCPQNTYWGGFKCQTIQNCRKGQYFDMILFRCQCIRGQFWNGQQCIQCQNGKIWNQITQSCSCRRGTLLQGDICRYNQSCSGGKIWIQHNQACQCPLKSLWNGSYCSFVRCQNGKYWNSNSQICECGQYLNQVNGICQRLQKNCTNRRIWNRQIYLCECPPGTNLQDQKCVLNIQCNNGKVFNSINNLCECPLQFRQVNGNCTNPYCQRSYLWNGFECEKIVCPPPSYFVSGRCIYPLGNGCGHLTYWNGKQCSFYSISCPNGTNWTNLYCESFSKCRNGQYLINDTCQPFPQKCLGSATWNGSYCSSGNKCPSRTYQLNGQCKPIFDCRDGYIWDIRFLKCICPQGTINNGKTCIQCSNGRQYRDGIGCQCPVGLFDTGAYCEELSEQRCLSIPNSLWRQDTCQCQNGFTKIDVNCLCQGVVINSYCDRCSYRLNSVYNKSLNKCICKPNYILIQQKCIPLNKYSKNDNHSKCSVGTFYEMSTKMCLPCPRGCLSCFNTYKCRICQPQYYYNHKTDLCYELCGDGRKFQVQCDDGNNLDGDGCTRDCRIQQDYQCLGGSPSSRDFCLINKPKLIKFIERGQIRRETSVTVHIQLNYFPKSLLLSADCNYRCSKVLQVKIIDGDQDIKYIKSQILPGKNNIFGVRIEFGRNLFGKFAIIVGLNSSIVKYFSYISFLPLKINIQPKHLLQVSQL